VQCLQSLTEACEQCGYEFVKRANAIHHAQSAAHIRFMQLPAVKISKHIKWKTEMENKQPQIPDLEDVGMQRSRRGAWEAAKVARPQMEMVRRSGSCCTPRATSQSQSEANVDSSDWQNQSPFTSALPVTLETARSCNARLPTSRNHAYRLMS